MFELTDDFETVIQPPISEPVVQPFLGSDSLGYPIRRFAYLCFPLPGAKNGESAVGRVLAIIDHIAVVNVGIGSVGDIHEVDLLTEFTYTGPFL